MNLYDGFAKQATDVAKAGKTNCMGFASFGRRRKGTIIGKLDRPINVAAVFEQNAIAQTSPATAVLATLIGRFHFTIA